MVDICQYINGGAKPQPPSCRHIAALGKMVQRPAERPHDDDLVGHHNGDGLHKGIKFSTAETQGAEGEEQIE